MFTAVLIYGSKLYLAVLFLEQMKLVNYVYDGRMNKPFHDFFSFNSSFLLCSW